MQMYNVALTREELNVLMFALNNMSLIDEDDFEKNGVSIGTLYNKICTAWESLNPDLTN